jgi:Phospholipid-translocating P-type ATPase C-terminal
MILTRGRIRSSLALHPQIFSGLPILLLGVFDQDVSAKTALNFPFLYMDGLLDRRLNLRVFL